MKVYVGNIPEDWNGDSLIEIFKKFGAVGARVIRDDRTGFNRGFGFVEFNNSADAERAIDQMHDKLIPRTGQRLVVKRANNRKKKKFKGGKRSQLSDSKEDNNTSSFPYFFIHRKPPEIKSTPPSHAYLAENRYDVAFDIVWKALTPLAANPCTDIEKPSCYPQTGEGEYSGYNKRWLIIDHRLVISPFTVKSAIANAFTNIMGGCIRVQTSVEPHRECEQGAHPFTGCYKRYRVSMAKSKPGILLEKKEVDGGIWVEIMPVKEYYYDKHDTLPEPLKQGDEVWAEISERGKKPPIITTYSKTADGLKTKGSKILKVKYFGTYSFGMELKKKKHKHRFYSEISDEENGKTVTGVIPAINFESLDRLKEKVHMGQFNHDKEKQWFQPLSDLKDGDWVYYELFDGKVTNIGKNFLFKALFLHEDTVPSNQRVCTNKSELCPRCSMFGMTEKDGRNGQDAVGYKGRFKAAALVSDRILEKEDEITARIPMPDDSYENVPLHQWTKDGKTITRQFLMPIQQTPKNNHRDVDGYYDPESGLIKGIKTYYHSGTIKNLNFLENCLKGIDCHAPSDYSHKLRSYAEVCESGIEFRGTVGAENCSAEEIAVFLIILHSDILSHGYKIGKCKALGLGSIESKVLRIWIRHKGNKENCKWKKIEIESSIENSIKDSLPEVFEEFEGLKKIEQLKRQINSLEGYEKRDLEYPKPKNYWKEAAHRGMNQVP